MRSPRHSPSPTHPRRRALGQAGSDRLTAERQLGASHPLVNLLRRSGTLLEQMMWVIAVQAVGLGLFAGGLRSGLWLAPAGAVVQVALGVRIAVLNASKRELCLALIVEGRPGLAVSCVDRERRRLLDPLTLEQLARSVDDIVAIAARPLARVPASRPLFDVRVIRRVAPELRETASLLRGGDPSVRGVAAVVLLLTSSATPLYGRAVVPLRQELWRARYLLSGTAPQEEPAPRRRNPLRHG